MTENKNARTTVNLPIPQDASALHQAIVNLLISDGYSQFNYPTGELVWKKGDGVITYMRFIKLNYQTGVLILSGWRANGIENFISREYDLELKGLSAVLNSGARKTFDSIQKLVESMYAGR